MGSLNALEIKINREKEKILKVFLYSNFRVYPLKLKLKFKETGPCNNLNFEKIGEKSFKKFKRPVSY